MQKDRNTTYPISHQAVVKGSVSPTLAVTQLDENSYRVELPIPRELGLATNFYSKDGFLARYVLVNAEQRL